MSEHAFVEKPFLDQLAALDWQVVDQGPGVPTDPTKSFRTSFREVILKDIFQAKRARHQPHRAGPAVADRQATRRPVSTRLLNQPSRSLVEANEAVLKLLYRAQVDVNEVTGEQYPNVKLIDFDHPERNHFLAINQFRIDTPGAGKGFIIPDIVLFVNGLPLVVIECKDANDFTANPMYEAFQQLMRYSDQREETKQAGLREGEPRLFYTNQFLIRTCGDQADFGTITSTDEEFFYPWKDICPEKYRKFTPPLGQVRAAGNADPGDAAEGDAARHRADLHRVHGRGQGPGEDRRPLPAISGGVQDHRPAAHGRDAGGSVGRHLAHAGVGQVAHDGLRDPQAAHVRRPEGLQGLPRQRPQRPGEATRRDGGTDRREGHVHRQFRKT